MGCSYCCTVAATVAAVAATGAAVAATVAAACVYSSRGLATSVIFLVACAHLEVHPLADTHASDRMKQLKFRQ
jgi:hypothetical protein